MIGTIDIDLERKLVMHKEKDANIWKPPEIDHKEVEECKKFKAPAHQVCILTCQNLRNMHTDELKSIFLAELEKGSALHFGLPHLW